MADAQDLDYVDVPGWKWWVGIMSGLALLFLQAFNTTFYEFWTSTFHALPSQGAWQLLCWVCIPIHVGEGFWAFEKTRALGYTNSAKWWGIQCFFIGFPSTYLLLQRLKKYHPSS